MSRTLTLATVLYSLLVSPWPAAGWEVVRGPFEDRLLLTGELTAEEAVDIIVPNARIWPVQVRWLAEEGTSVRQGDLLVEFDNSQIVGNLEELEKAVDEERNRLASLVARTRSDDLQADFAAEQSRAAYEKAKIDASIPEGLLARKEYEERQLELERTELKWLEARRARQLRAQATAAELARQRIAVERAEQRAELSREGIRLLSIRAPRDGILLVAENLETGRLFRTGDNTYPGATVARMPDLDSILVEAALFDVDEGRVPEGIDARVRIDAFPGRELDARIASVQEVAVETSPESVRRVFKLRVQVAGLEPEIMRPGMSARVEIVSRLESVLLVPREAIRWETSVQPVSTHVRVESGGWTEIEVERCHRELCWIQAGLKEGQRLLPLEGSPD